MVCPEILLLGRMSNLTNFRYQRLTSLSSFRPPLEKTQDGFIK